MNRRRLWLILAVVTVVALGFGASSKSRPSAEDRMWSVARSVRCPTCSGQSVATSDAPAAKSIRAQIKSEIADGRSDDEIRTSLAQGSYGEDILLNPPRSGFAALVWVVPVCVVVVAFAGLALALRRWEPTGENLSQAERDLVSDALGFDAHGEGSGR